MSCETLGEGEGGGKRERERDRRHTLLSSIFYTHNRGGAVSSVHIASLPIRSLDETEGIHCV